MPELLAALCSVMLATGAVASSPLPACLGYVTPLQEAAGSQGAQKGAPAAPDTQTPLQKAQALLAKVPSLENPGENAPTLAKRLELLAGADKLCDEADKVAGDEPGKRLVLDVRWALASRAFEIEDWSVGVQLYGDALPYIVSNWGPEDAFTLKAKGALAACLSGAERSKPTSGRRYEMALTIFREVADAWDSKFKSAEARASTGPWPELDGVVRAHRDLGLTLQDSGAQAEAKRQFEIAFDLLRAHPDRLADPRVLWWVYSDLLNHEDNDGRMEMLDATAGILQRDFPDRRDLLLDVLGDRGKQFAGLGRLKEAEGVAHETLHGLDSLESYDPENMVHALAGAGNALLQTGHAKEAEVVFRRAVDCAAANGMPLSNINVSFVHVKLCEALVNLGRNDEAISRCNDDLTAIPTMGGAYVIRAVARRAKGDFADALDDFNHALEIFAEGDSYRSVTLGNVASLFLATDAIGRALEILEELRCSVEQYPPIGDGAITLPFALLFLAQARYAIGDFERALALGESALEKITIEYGRDSFTAQTVRLLCGECQFALGRPNEAAQFARELRDWCIQADRRDLDYYLFSTLDLSQDLVAAGRWDDAQSLADECIRAADSWTPPCRWVAGGARAVLGSIALGRGDAQKAVALLRDGLAEMDADPDQRGVRAIPAYFQARLLSAVAALQDTEPLRAELRRMARDAKLQLDSISLLSARERSGIVTGLLNQAEHADALRRSRPDALEAQPVFEWLATLRAAAGPLEVERLRAGGTRIQELRTEHMRTRRRVAALSLRSGFEGEVGGADLLTKAVTERDAAERALLKELPPGSKFAWISTADLADALQRHGAIGVSIHRIHAAPPQQPEDSYTAFVVDRTASLRSVDLGPAAAIEEKILAWRAAVIGSERGKPVNGENHDLAELGAALRAAVLDPLLKDVAEKRVFLCLDDALHTIPWDVLPAARASSATNGAAVEGATSSRGARPPAAGELVGDQFRIAELSSFRELLESSHRSMREPTLIAFGNIDYSAPGAAAKDAPLADRPMRGSAEAFGPFDPLVDSADEIKGIAQTFETMSRRKARTFTGSNATKEALFSVAKDATYLHISTHGYFASENVVALGDSGRNPMLRTVTGCAPMTLCGLALAGANRDVGPRDEVVGIATAEELAGLDLAACRLAVLSGCETSLGVRRAGQDLASLKAALHAAGAGSVIASLWGVPDTQTSQLMRRFYRNLWEEKQPPDEALWNAKKSLGDQPLRAWAGWVFSGVPEGK